MRLEGIAISPAAGEQSFRQSELARRAFITLDRWGPPLSLVLNGAACLAVKAMGRPHPSGSLCGHLFVVSNILVVCLLVVNHKRPELYMPHRTKIMVSIRLLRLVQAYLVGPWPAAVLLAPRGCRRRESVLHPRASPFHVPLGPSQVYSDPGWFNQIATIPQTTESRKMFVYIVGHWPW